MTEEERSHAVITSVESGESAPGVIADTWTGSEVARSAHLAPSRACVIGGIIVLSVVQPRRATLREKANMGAL